MKEKTRKYIVFGMLPIAIIWAVYNFSGDKKSTQPEVPKLSEKAEAAVIDVPREKIDVDKYNKMGWGKDPFYRGRKTVAPSASYSFQQKWQLAGILYSKHNPYAVINKKIVRPGDTINGALVINIEKDEVILEKNGSQFKLSISKEKT